MGTGSNFFSEIFMKSKHDNMLVYLKGISSNNLAPLIDFIYNGKALIAHEELNVFLETGKELQVKGLKGELREVVENTYEAETHSQEYYETYDDYANEKVPLGLVEDKKDIVAKMDVEILQITNELSFQISEMIEKNGDMWTCKICGKTKSHKGDLQKHAETHIKGMSHPCHMCSKTFTNRRNLRDHISGTHSELLSC